MTNFLTPGESIAHGTTDTDNVRPVGTVRSTGPTLGLTFRSTSGRRRTDESGVHNVHPTRGPDEGTHHPPKSTRLWTFLESCSGPCIPNVSSVVKVTGREVLLPKGYPQILVFFNPVLRSTVPSQDVTRSTNTIQSQRVGKTWSIEIPPPTPRDT